MVITRGFFKENKEDRKGSIHGMKFAFDLNVRDIDNALEMAGFFANIEEYDMALRCMHTYLQKPI